MRRQLPTPVRHYFFHGIVVSWNFVKTDYEIDVSYLKLNSNGRDEGSSTALLDHVHIQ